jgi:hypothetical protein
MSIKSTLLSLANFFVIKLLISVHFLTKALSLKAGECISGNLSFKSLEI